MGSCGLDFGTSNSSIAVARGDEVQVLPAIGGERTVPSAMFYFDESVSVSYGEAAIQAYLDEESGRLMRAIKSVLGTSLMDEKTQVGTRLVSYRDVVKGYLLTLKNSAQEQAGIELDSVVQGRPVHFVDGDLKADNAAQDSLQGILNEIGFKSVAFQFEPLAAMRTFGSTVAKESLVLVVDVGGGTSDFSLVRLKPNVSANTMDREDILGTHGIRLGGTDIDQKLSLERLMPLLGMGARVSEKQLVVPKWIYSHLSSWSLINRIYQRKFASDIEWVTSFGKTDIRFQRLKKAIQNRLGHLLAKHIETAKIDLSTKESSQIDLQLLEAGLNLEIKSSELPAMLATELSRLREAINECIRVGNTHPDEIDYVLMTGGSTEMPLVRAMALYCCPNARIEAADTFGAVAKGLAIQAEH